ANAPTDSAEPFQRENSYTLDVDVEGVAVLALEGFRAVRRCVRGGELIEFHVRGPNRLCRLCAVGFGCVMILPYRILMVGMPWRRSRCSAVSTAPIRIDSR
ncbi:hypothetical protein EXE53_30435, partial [Halorubrum sp. SD626R]